MDNTVPPSELFVKFLCIDFYGVDVESIYKIASRIGAVVDDDEMRITVKINTTIKSDKPNELIMEYCQAILHPVCDELDVSHDALNITLDVE